MDQSPSATALKLWYHRPAGQDWNSALPIGAGRLGAMIFGNPRAERVALNEDSLWSGGQVDRTNPAAHEALPAIREKLAKGQVKEAQDLANQSLAGTPDGMRAFEPLGDLLLRFEHDDAATDYRRELDLETAAARVEYHVGSVVHRRTYAISGPENALAIRLEASAPGAISLQVRLERKAPEGANTGYVTKIVKAMGGATGLTMLGRPEGDPGGLRFAACFRVVAEGGTAVIEGDPLAVTVKGADAVTIVLCAATSFREPDPTGYATGNSASIASRGWKQFRATQEVDYRGLFERLTFRLGSDEEAERVAQIPTDERLKRVAAGEADPSLAALYLQFGRYLLISSSRPGSLPANLQGLWNQEFNPPWGSKYTLNINAQMNYWPVETGNLAECHGPLLALVERMVEPGRRTAKQMYGCEGFVAHHNTDLWADTTPVDQYPAASYWPLGGAWLALHLWEHYNFSQDRSILPRAYNVMKEASRFFLDFLIPDSEGRLIVSPSVSPENSYKTASGDVVAMSAGCSMDASILRALFSATAQAAVQLERDPDFRKSLDAALARLPELQIGQHGQVMEWLEDYEEAEPEHRHISHLFPLFPGDQITPGTTPELAEAARITLDRRGEGGTGWSLAWKINLRARLTHAEYAHQLLLNLLKPATGAEQPTAGTYTNLFCAHPPLPD